MDTNRIGIAGLLLGRHRRTTERYLGGLLSTVLGLLVLQLVIPSSMRESLHGGTTGAYVTALALGLVVVSVAAYAYMNDGLVPCWLGAFLIFPGLVISGLFQIGVGGGGVAGLILIPFAFAGVVGSLGFVLGVSAKWITLKRQKQQNPSQ